MNTDDILKANQILSAAKDVAYAIALAIADQEARSYDDFLTKERLAEWVEDVYPDFLDNRDWGTLAHGDHGYGRYNLGSVTVNKGRVKFAFDAQRWGDYFTAPFDISIELFDAFGNETPDEALKASEIRKHVDAVIGPIRAEIEEKVRLEEKRAAEMAIAQEEHDKEEFRRLSEKFKDGVPD